MIKIFSVRKILIASLLLLVALILYSYPEELDDNVIEKKYDSINIYLIDSIEFFHYNQRNNSFYILL